MAQGQRWHIYSVQTDVCFPYGRWWKCWAAVGRRSPLPRTAYQMKLGAPEWFECSRALVCSSSEVFTSASQNILGLFVLSNIAHVLSIFHYGQFFHRYVRWWFKPQNYWNYEGSSWFISIFVACPCCLFNSLDCWFQSIVVGLTLFFLLPSLIYSVQSPLIVLLKPAFLSCWNSSISLVSVDSTPNLIHFIPIFATEILLFATKPGRKHCPKWTLSSPWQICMRRPHWHSKNKTFAIKSGDIMGTSLVH